MLNSAEQYAYDALQAGSVIASNRHTSSKITGLANSIRNTMILGIAVTPTFSYANCADSAEKNKTTVQVASGDSHSKMDVAKNVPTIYVEGGALCCDVHRDEPVVDYAHLSQMSTVATDVLRGTQPLQGAAYNHLSRLVRKNAKKQSSIVGML